MDNLVFSLNATVPIFLMMILGLFFNKIGWMDEEFANKMNKFVFRIPLPVLLFGDLAVVDIKEAWDTKFVIFCFIITLISITIAIGISCLLKDRSIQGEFIQGAYRSSAALLGIAFIQNIYGNSGQAPLMIIGSVPLYNIMAVVVLSFFKPGQNGMDKALLKKTLTGIITNPIIIGIFLGLVVSLLGVHFPTIVDRTVDNVARMATPLALVTMGAGFEGRKALAKIKPTLAASFIKLVAQTAVFLPIAAAMGFTGEKIIGILIMLAAPTTPSCYIMAKNMKNDGVLTASIVVTTTLLASFTLTGWIYLLKCTGLIG